MNVFKYIVVNTLLVIGLQSCQKEPNEILATSVTINQTSINIPVGQSSRLFATVLPENTTNKTITWSSSDRAVAIVHDGIVTTLKVGHAIVSATCGTKSGSCVVNVMPINIEEITLDRTSASLKAGETVTLTATVKPDDATDKTVTWTTSDASVATVSDGVVTAKKVGSATITA